MKTLKANGAEIPALGLGTFGLKGPQCVDIVTKALRAGYRHIDTAAFYENEEPIGAAIAASGIPRDELFITTKVWPSEISQGAFQKSVEASLSRLGLEQVDLLLIHWPPQNDDIAEWARLLCEAARKGQARHIGVSNFTTTLLDKMVEACELPLVVNQVECHPYLDQTKIRAACSRHGMALMAYCPLGKGRELIEEPVITALASEYERSPAQIVLRWHIQHQDAGAIPKTATPERLLGNLDIFDFELSDADMARINTLKENHIRICDYLFSPQWDAP
ncbi:MAG: aldo/keto reductase [Rhizobiaceae bacterium]